MSAPRAHISQDERDEFAQYVPILCGSGLVNDWERQFCISIVGRLKRGPWWPTEKQAPVLRRLVDRLKADMMADPGVVLDDD